MLEESEVIPGQTEIVISEQPTARSNPTSRSKWTERALNELDKTDKIVVQQMLDLREAVCCCQGENQFEVSDRFGHVLFKASEDSSCCSRNCCEQLRAFRMSIQDRDGNEVLIIERPFRCNNLWCCPCWNQELSVESPDGEKFGILIQNLSIFRPSFTLQDKNGDDLYSIKGPSACRCNCCSTWPAMRICCARYCCRCCSPDIKFQILDAATNSEVGFIAKMWDPDQIQDSSRDKFSIDFPDEANVQAKTLLVAACFLIDYLFFEGD